MHIDVTVSMPELWNDSTFQKLEWGPINFLVGPNATGKTRFAEQLKNILTGQGLRPRYLSAERLIGLERVSHGVFSSGAFNQGINFSQFQDYKRLGFDLGTAADGFINLKEKCDIRVRVEAFLSTLFGRKLRLAEEGGYLRPKLQVISGGNEYDLKQAEAQGLKELISVLAVLYDDSHNCLILDEPELHLHPQFQSFLSAEIRRLAGDPRVDPTKKLFFLITHSPYFIDLKTLDDLKSVLVFRAAKPPTCISGLDPEDEFRLRRLLPRLNTHHKQFFFATRPVFVEGYLDQQLFGLIQDRRERPLGAAGVSIIDVGGKDELDMFFRLCRKLAINGQFIADLDALFWGKLRQSAALDPVFQTAWHAEGLGLDFARAVDEVLKAADGIANAVLQAPNLPGPVFVDLRKALDEAGGDAKKSRYASIMACLHHRVDLESFLPTAQFCMFVVGKVRKIRECLQQVGVFLLPLGELENHFPSFKGNVFVGPSDSAKLSVFEEEQNYLLTGSPNDIEKRYPELVGLLDFACQAPVVDVEAFLNYELGDWIHKVQSTFVRREVRDTESLKRNASVSWSTYSRLFDIVDFTSPGPQSFTCTIRVSRAILGRECTVSFTQETVPSGFRLPGPAQNGA